MLIMKAIFLLMECSIINILGVNSQCVPAELIGFDPAQLASGPWELYKVSPNIFTQLTNVTENMQYDDDGDKFSGTISLTFYGKPPEEHNNTLYVKGNALDIYVEGLSQFNSLYEILATDYNTYFIKKGHPNATSPEALIAIFTKDRCPDAATDAAIDQAIQSQCWDVNDFHKDPSLSTVCQ